MLCASCFTTVSKGVECTSCGKHMHKECAVKCLECGEYMCDMCALDNKFKCKKCYKEEVLDIDFVRRSHIELYKSCPYAFYLEVIKKVETENNPYAEVGIMLHDIFDYYSNHRELNYAGIKEMFLEEYAKVDRERYEKRKPGLHVALKDKGLRSIEGFVEYDVTAEPAFVTEQTLFYEIDRDLPKIRITMDRINKVDGKLHIVDYKTGKVHVGKKLANDLQIPTYILAVAHEYGELPASFKLLFVSENKERTYVQRNDDEYVCTVRNKEYVVSLQEAIREIKIIFGRIKQKQFNVPPKISGFYCKNMCYFGYSGTCQGGQEESWRQINKSRGE